MTVRVDRLLARLPQGELDGLLISAPQNRRYLSGFTGSAGYLLLTGRQALLFTDSRYTEQATNQASDFQVVPIRGGWDWLPHHLRGAEVKRLGFESDHLTVAAYHQLLDALKEVAQSPALIPTTGITEELRAAKDHDELAQLQEAVDASDAALEAVCPTLREGMTEREVAWRMEVAMRNLGADGVSFDPIVASGPNGAMAHHRPSDRAIRAGEPVVIDMGARVGGYCSDITRTMVVGEPDDTFRRIYDLVLGAQLTAINTIRPGMTGEEADGLARGVIAHAGYGENFGHGLGHGIGLAVHESPRIGPGSCDTLRPDMVFTVEPGIYLTGWGGVRIEDMVLLGEEGATPMSKAGK